MTLGKMMARAPLIAACLALMLQVGLAQRPGSPTDPEHTRQVLVANARALEARGRPDMAIQIWQQILLSDPNNTEALAGLARDYKLRGSTKEADQALEKLRAVNPNDPNIPRIEALTSTHVQSDDLRRAGQLASQGKNDEAMATYRRLYGDHPPDGEIALAYYQTLYGTPGGKEQAIAGMRGLASRNPEDARYSIELGRMLTYDPRTRADGIRILKQHPLDPDARNALRQALIWDSANPATAGELRQYLKEHPQDTEIAQHLRQDEAKLAQMNAGIARTSEERAAFAALNARHLDEAEKRFTDLLQKDPSNGRVAAGMGFLRMQQQNFGGAVSYLTQAEQIGFKDRSVENALETSRFWFTMGEASQAFDSNQFDVAADKYRAALEMRPKSPEALNGLAGLLLKQQQYQQAAAVYDQLLKVQPANPDAWRGLFICYARDGQNQKALAVANRFPPRIKADLARDPEYLRTLATIYYAMGRSIEAQKVLAQALALPFPDNGMNLKQDTRLQYAGILMLANRFSQAAELYAQILTDDPSNLAAWMGLVSVHHQLGQDSEAIADVEKMSPATYESALADAGFLDMLGSIYQRANQLEIAQSLLERSVKLQQAAGGQPGMQIEMQLAGIYLQRGDTARAYPIYRQVLTAHPDRQDAWKGLIASLQATNHTAEALEQLAYIPPDVRKQLEADPLFVQTEASIYASAGDTATASAYMARVERYYAQQHAAMPAGLAIQNAWLLYNAQNDRALYAALMQLGARPDLTVTDRETVETIWANWAVRRAGAAIDNNDNERAVEILEAASLAFPENVQVKWVLAGGYLRTGQNREALALYKKLPIQDATVDQYRGAIGAALAANDRTSAETWLRQALERYPKDYHILGLAAKFEQARGDNERAADFWRAALAAMPANSPTDRLAHDLDYPDQDNNPHKARTAADLQLLLNPDYAASTQPFQKTVKLPPLPAYGPDPYETRPPVVIVPVSPAPAPPTTELTVPTTTRIPLPQSATPPAHHTAKSKAGSGVSQAAPSPSSAGQPAATGQAGAAEKATAAGPAAAKSSPAHRARKPAQGQSSVGPVSYSGQVHLAPSEEYVTTTDAYKPPAQASPAQPKQPVYIPTPPVDTTAPRFAPATPGSDAIAPHVFIPQPQASNTPPNTPSNALSNAPSNAPNDPRVHAAFQFSPDGPAAAVQAQFAQQTDAQLTQADAQIRPLGNVPVLGPGPRNTSAVASVAPILDGAQYTPSAQEAATGAYSANGRAQQTQQAAPPPPQTNPNQAAPPPTSGKKHRKKRANPNTESVPTLVTAPNEQNPAAPQLQNQQDQQQQQQPAAQQPADNNPGGLTDEQLQQQNLPPLRGPWVRVQREPRPISPREEAEQQLTALESGYSGWLGGAGLVNYRSGSLGYDRLAALEAPFEASAPLGYHARLVLVARPVFLDSGQADGTSTLTVQEFTNVGRTLVSIPQPLGTDTNTGPSAGPPATIAPPLQQNAAGIAGEVQLVTSTFGAAAGYTPFGFLVADWTARGYWRPANGPFTFAVTRDSIKDSQLSYSGLRDPGTASLSFPGVIWGGVIANQGNAQFSRGDAMSGFYVGVGGQYIRGHNVKDNLRLDGNGGAYWRIKAYPEYGTLSIGANFFGMHYDNNQDAFTFGMGGYFSPQFYFLANVPLTWEGHYQTHLHYEVVGGGGVQAFQQDATPLFPLAGQKATEIALKNAELPALTTVSGNYNFRTNVAYQIGPHWFVGAFFSANNSRNYNAASLGFSIHYMFRSQPSTATAPTGLFPTEGLRPFTVP
jgi:tetratricopeptide (TPR) repeat protein